VRLCEPHGPHRIVGTHGRTVWMVVHIPGSDEPLHLEFPQPTPRDATRLCNLISAGLVG
jgi:hypothetical protein